MKCPTLLPTVVISDDAELAAMLSCALARPGAYLPVIDGPRMTRADSQAEATRRNNGVARARAKEVYYAGLNAEAEAALDRYLQRVGPCRISDGEAARALAAQKCRALETLQWSRQSIGLGLLTALRTGKMIAFADEPSPALQVLGKSDHLVVCEAGEPLSEVIAANYAFALGAGLCVIPERSKHEGRSILEAFYGLLAWAQREQCPAWHADALRRLVGEGKLTDKDLDELVMLARRENGANDVEIEPIPLVAGHIPASPKDDKSVALLCLRDTTGVNQLAAKQQLHFEAVGINIVYGDNGAGKSGYARILKRACRARSRGAIIPDAFDDNAPKTPANAAFDYLQGGAKADPILWTDGPEPDAILSAVSVFDRQSGNVHLTGKNDVAFRPHGLDVPDELADAFGTIKNLLSAEQGELHRHQHVTFAAPPWSPETKVGRILNALKADTDLAALTTLAEVTEDEKKRHTQLLKDLAHDPVEAAAEKRVHIENLERLASALRQLHDGASDDCFAPRCGKSRLLASPWRWRT